MKRILETALCIMWMITGCGLDGMFESEESFWTMVVVAFVTILLIAVVLWGNNGRKK